MKPYYLLLAAALLAACGEDSSSASVNDVDGPSSSSISGEELDSSDAMSSSTPVEDPESSSSSEAVGVSYGTLTDSRDGQVYKTVIIGDQEWMAENLNYAYTGVKYSREESTSDSSSWCYLNSSSNCKKYGCLYTWAAAMDSAGLVDPAGVGLGCGYGESCSVSGTVRGVCPEGWHLPTQGEWETLFTEVGGTSVAAAMLKSTSGWSSDGNGSDDYGFSVLPAGFRNNDQFVGVRDNASFWSSTEKVDHNALAGSNDWNPPETNKYCAWAMVFGSIAADVIWIDYGEFNGFSVRCLRDN